MLESPRSVEQPWSALTTPVYDLRIRIDHAATYMEVEGSLRFDLLRDTAGPVVLRLHETMDEPWMEIVEPADLAGEVAHRGLEEGATEHQLSLRPLSAGARVVVRFRYRGGRRSGNQFHLDERICIACGFGTAWYPQVIETQGNGDEETLRGSGRICVHVPVTHTVVIPGATQRTIENGEIGDGEEERRHEFDVTMPTQLTLLSGVYRRHLRHGEIPVTAFLLRDREEIATYLDGCARILDLLASEFGAYGHESFTLVEFPQDVGERLGVGGASVQGGIMMPGDALDVPFNLALYGHEIAHQWWGIRVGNTGARGFAMMDEAMAQYGALRCVEELEGAAAAEQFRRTGYPGYIPNQSGFGYLRCAAAGFDEPLSRLTFSHLIDDSKGFIVYDMLARTIGHERLRAAWRAITTRFTDEPIDWKTFLHEIERAAGQDLGWFYTQWLDRTGTPEWTLEWKQRGDLLEGVVTQTEPFYRLRLELEVRGTDGQVSQHRLDLINATTTFSIPVEFTVHEAVLDPHFRVLHWDPRYKEEAFALISATRMRVLQMRGAMEEAGQVYTEAIQQLPTPDPHGVEFSVNFEMGRLHLLRGNYPEALEYFMAAVRCASRRVELLPRAYLNLAIVASKLDDRETVQWAARAAVTADEMAGGRYGVAVLAWG